MNKGLSVILAIIGCIGVVFSVIMMIMAVRFMELGRVILHLLLDLGWRHRRNKRSVVDAVEVEAGVRVKVESTFREMQRPPICC